MKKHLGAAAAAAALTIGGALVTAMPANAAIIRTGSMETCHMVSMNVKECTITESTFSLTTEQDLIAGGYNCTASYVYTDLGRRLKYTCTYTYRVSSDPVVLARPRSAR